MNKTDHIINEDLFYKKSLSSKKDLFSKKGLSSKKDLSSLL